MKIKKIVSRNRRDFYAIYKCENCKSEMEKSGYDDEHFHNNVIPDMKCDNCGESQNSLKIKSPKMTPRYPENQTV